MEKTDTFRHVKQLRYDMSRILLDKYTNITWNMEENGPIFDVFI